MSATGGGASPANPPCRGKTVIFRVTVAFTSEDQQLIQQIEEASYCGNARTFEAMPAHHL